jgi:hypothetical protein
VANGIDPLHVFSQPYQVEAVEGARRMVAGSRPIVVHVGREVDAEQHVIARGAGECWCESVTIPAG